MATAIKLKQINMEKVRSELKSLDTYTKNTLAESTGLSVATCGNILKEMIDSNEVYELENAESTGGRPCRQFLYNKNYSYVLTLYLRKEGKDKSIFYAVSNVAGEVIYENLLESTGGSLLQVDEIVRDALAEYKNIKVLALGVPAVIEDGVVENCCFEEFSDLDIISHYQDLFDIEVAVMNDVNCIALGFHRRKKLSNAESVVYMYYPHDDCPGSGIIINGKVLNGVTNFAGEIGNLPHYLLGDKSANIELELCDFSEGVLRTIMSINSLINPRTIVLSGYQFDDEMINKIKDVSGVYIPDVHMPIIEHEKDIHESYINGLTSIALEQLTYNFNI